MMRKPYNQMVLEKNQIKGDNLVQIGGIKKEKNPEKGTRSRRVTLPDL